MVAGVAAGAEIDLTWVAADVARFGLGGRFALLAPGGSAHRPEKRWPAASYAALARHLAGVNVRPVLLGGPAEAAVLEDITAGCPEALNLCGETSFEDIIVLARGAALAVGNDTGPMHLIGAADCPSLVLYSKASDPARTVPRGADVHFLQRPSLDDLTPAEVIAAAAKIGI
jgi:ADP-heptose:LPS heptosyltransferase